MSQQALDLRKSIKIVRRHRLLAGVTVALGLLAGGAYAVLHPPTVTSTALVLLPQWGQAAQNGAAAAANGTGPDPYTATQEVIAESNPVLLGALPDVRPAMSITDLRRAVGVGSLTPYVISISVTGKSAADAIANTNAVANTYIRYIGSASIPGGKTPAGLLQAATTATGTSRLKHFVIYALAGAIAGALIGIIIALAVGRSDRRLRERDDIANSIGAPVLASFPVGHPSDPRGWTRLLEDYKPGASHALQVQGALQELEMASSEERVIYPNSRWSFTVLSLSSDPGALALGPQMAVFAASQGIRTALVIGPQQDATVAASLQVACGATPASPKQLRNLQLFVTDSDVEVEPDVDLTVVVAVVVSRTPQVPDTIRTTSTVLGVSAGMATADQLARVAVSAASSGRDITGILVADPDPADATTGRLPQLRRRTQRRTPTRMTGIATEIRR
jgi:capsular polysaccharide biosynthesis protein